MAKPNLSRSLTKIAFGSCNRTHKDQSFWDTIAKLEPDLWISLGDNIYADDLSIGDRLTKYRQLRANFHYSRFVETIPVIGTWDDHDYASNNCGGEFEEKSMSRELFLDFFDLDFRKFNDISGVYQSFTFGPRGQRTKIVLLDCRYNMDAARTHKQLLGQEQWHWLDRELASADFDLLILGSSIGLTSEAVGLGIEGWASYGEDQHRLYSSLNALNLPTLILSGDRHQADISRIKLESGANIYEFMSSGLTHALPIPIPNSARISQLIGERNFGWLEIDWNAPRPSLTMQIRSPSSGLIYDQFRV